MPSYVRSDLPESSAGPRSFVASPEVARGDSDLLERALDRQRLIDLIESPNPAPVILITAPAGFGKTTVAAQWAVASQRRAAWVTLRPESNSPDRFLSDLLRALDPLHASSRNEYVTIDEIMQVAGRLAETEALAIVLDDYHAIESPDVLQLTDVFIRELPEGLPLVIVSRGQPQLSLSRLRLNGLVREITETDLRFDQAEIQELIGNELAGQMPEDSVRRLAERTDGWIAGIRLALLAMEGSDAEHMDGIIAGLSANQWLDDYVVEEVINQLSEEIRLFVLKTASLDTLEPELCDAVLQSNRSASIIDELTRRLVFVRRDRNAGAPFRYHALFAECVRRIAARRLPTAEIQLISTRAAAWSESQGHIETAIEYALHAGDIAAATRLTSQLCRTLLDQGQFGSMLYWISRLPREVVLADPDLAYWNVLTLITVGRIREARDIQVAVEPRWLASGDPIHRGYAAAARGTVATFAGETVEPLFLSYQALHWFPPELRVYRHHAWSEVAIYEFLRGNDELVEQAYRQAEWIRQWLPGTQRYWSVFMAAERANWYAMRGDLHTSERLLTENMHHMSIEFRDAEARFRYRRLAILLEWNHLERARSEVDLLLQDRENFPLKSWWSEALIVVARVFWANGEQERARATIQQILDFATDHGGTHFSAGALALQAAQWIETGELELARDWRRFRPAVSDQWPRDFGDVDTFAPQVQLLIAEQAFAEASAMVRERIELAHQNKQWATIIPLYLWEFVAQMHLGNENAACDALAAALNRGMAGGFVRSFAPPGIDIVPLLQTALPKLAAAEAAYLDHVIDQIAPSPPQPLPTAIRDGTFEADTGSHIAPPLSLAEPVAALSRREAQVVALLGQGASNQQIADALFISGNTVKKHMSNIFVKFDVASRTAAVLRARELGLLK